MEERRRAHRLRTNIDVRWETLKTQGRGAIADLSASGCFVLTGGEVSPRELARLDLVVSGELTTLWGSVVYAIPEMGFAVRFVFASETDQQSIERVIRRVS